MLVATPAQTAARYPLHSSTITSTTTTTGTAATTTSKLLNNSNNNNQNNSHNNSLHGHKHKLTESSGASRASALMKTLSVRLNRGTEFLKGTVQKALVSTTITNNPPQSTSYNNQYNLNHHVTAPTASSIHSNVAELPATAAAAATAATATAARYNTVTTSAATSSSSSTAAPAAAAATTTTSSTSTLARTIAKATAITTLHKLYTVPPTATHRFPEERKQADSVDSLHKEMCHFKPIRAVPTTPWKCTSRSRGASLRIPKASLATNTALISNCDDERNVGDDEEYAGTENDDDDDDDGNNSNDDIKVKHSTAKYKMYRPKSSSNLLISSPITTHQSAFVCLASAQMKNITLSAVTETKAQQKRRQMASAKTDLHKTRSNRGRTKATRNTVNRNKSKLYNCNATTPTGQRIRPLLLRNGRNPLVPVKKINLTADIMMNRSLRNMRSKMNSQSTQTINKRAATKSSKKIEKSSTKLVSKNSRMVNIVKLAQEQRQRQNGDISTRIVETKRGLGRKRKIPNDLNVLDADTQAKATKRQRLTMADGRRDGFGVSNATALSTTTITTRKQNNALQQMAVGVTRRTGATDSVGSSNSRYNLANRCTPPLTRSRLKQMSHGKLFAALDYQHRVI